MSISQISPKPTPSPQTPPSTGQDEMVSLDKSGKKFIAQTACNFLVITPDTLHLQGRLSKGKELVPTQPPLKPYRVEYPFAQLRYHKYRSPSILTQFSKVGLLQQAKILMPARTLSAGVLVTTQDAVERRLGKTQVSTCASWLAGVAAQNAIDVPTSTIRYQIQSKQAKTPEEARKQILAQNGIKGFYKPYCIYTFTRTAIFLSYNQVSPTITSYIEKQYSDLPVGSQALVSFVAGAASGILVLPLSQFLTNISLQQINQNDKRNALTIGKDLVKKGPKEIWKGIGYGSQRIAFVGAIYSGTMHFLDKAEIGVKKKDLESFKNRVIDAIPSAADVAIGVPGNEKRVSEGLAKICFKVTSFIKGSIADVNEIGRDPVIDGVA